MGDSWRRFATATLIAGTLAFQCRAPAYAANSSAFLSGTVTNQGAPVAGARVSASGNNLTMRVTTNARGHFSFPPLPLGTYDVEANYGDLHDGHLHHVHETHVDEHELSASSANPANCTSGHDCNGHDPSHRHDPACGHEPVPHAGHVDFLVQGHIHNQHGRSLRQPRPPSASVASQGVDRPARSEIRRRASSGHR
jgi:Carboxypeptidase regulatory-like domain